MAAQTLAQKANALITYYVKAYQEVHPHAPMINRNKQRWGFQAMSQDLGYDRAKEVIDYFLSSKKVVHDVADLLWNYEKINVQLEEFEKDEKDRLKLRAATEKMVREMEERGNNRSKTPERGSQE